MPMRSLWQKVRIQERVQFHPRHARSRSKNAIPTSGCERMREWVYIEGVNGKKKKEKINKYIIYIKKKKKKRSLHCRLYLSRIMYFLHCRILSYDPQDLYHAQKFIQKKKKCSLPPPSIHPLHPPPHCESHVTHDSMYTCVYLYFVFSKQSQSAKLRRKNVRMT